MSEEKEVTPKEMASNVRLGSDIAPQPKPRVDTEMDGLFPTYCYMCNGGAPDVIKVRVKNGIPVNLEPNYDLSCFTPWGDRGWRPCSVAMQMINRHFNPIWVEVPMDHLHSYRARPPPPVSPWGKIG